MGEHSVRPLTTCLIKEAHELRHGYALRVQAEVCDAFELAGIYDELPLLFRHGEGHFHVGIGVSWNHLILVLSDLDAQTLCLALHEEYLLLLVLLLVERGEHVLQHPDGGRLTRARCAHDHHAMARHDCLVDIENVLDVFKRFLVERRCLSNIDINKMLNCKFDIVLII